MDLITKIENPELKYEYLKKFQKLIIEENSSSNPRQKICLNTTLEKFKKSKTKVTMQDLQCEIKNIKTNIILLKEQNLDLKTENQEIKQDLQSLKTDNIIQSPQEESSQNRTLNLINHIQLKKWHTKIKITIKDFELITTALVDSGAYLNCIQEGLIPTKYYIKTKEKLTTANGGKWI